MNCNDCQELLVEYSLGELDRSDSVRVDEHLATGCSACQHELLELQEVVGMLGASLDDVAPPPSVKQRLFTRIAAEGRAQPVDLAVERATIPLSRSIGTQPSSNRIVWRQAFAYAATLLCGFLIGALAVRQLARDNAVVDRDAQLAEILESARQSFGTPEVRFASLHPAQDENAVVGHLMWDAHGRNLHFFAFDVAPPAANHELAVWFVTSEGPPTYAGELKVSPTGTCSAVFQSPALDEPVTQIVVTEEVAGETTKPAGPQRIVSRFEQPKADS
ncbi:MAG: anti-sigma factor [Pirellulales bacterium]